MWSWSGCATPGPRERVVYREEKGSDVNPGAHLLMDAFRQRYDVAAVVTNDAAPRPKRMASYPRDYRQG